MLKHKCFTCGVVFIDSGQCLFRPIRDEKYRIIGWENYCPDCSRKMDDESIRPRAKAAIAYAGRHKYDGQ